jgi:hypothetical protein
MSQRRQIARLLPWLAGALVPLALIGWDARTPWTEFVESSQPIPKSLAEHIPRNASVYWEGGLEMLWLRMEQPSYFSCAQATEDLFFRDVALAYQRRGRGVLAIAHGRFSRIHDMSAIGQHRQTDAHARRPAAGV